MRQILIIILVLIFLPLGFLFGCGDHLPHERSYHDEVKFRGMKWGSSPEDLMIYRPDPLGEPKNVRGYYKAQEDLDFFGARASSIEYYYVDNKLYRIVIEFTKKSEWRKACRAIHEFMGDPVDGDGFSYWEDDFGNEITPMYKYLSIDFENVKLTTIADKYWAHWVEKATKNSGQ